MQERLKIAAVGSGYVGTVVSACFSRLGHQVVGVEVDADKLAQLQAGIPPFWEGGLDDLLAEQVASGRLTFTDDMDAALTDADVIFLCVGTPSGTDGHPNMSYVISAARSIGGALQGHNVIVTKSTVPIGSGMWLNATIDDALADAASSATFSVVSNPEFLREGTAIEDFLHPDRIVLGSEDQAAIDLVHRAYQPILDQTFEGGRPDVKPAMVHTGLVTAETVKYAANAFLAAKISFINEISQICERVGADITDVATAVGLDSRIGDKFLNAGIGWGGSCFGKDLDALAAIARDYGLHPRMLDAVREVNRSQRHLIVEKLQAELKTLRGRRVTLLGLSFKPGTDDLRDAPAIDIASRLVQLGATVSAFDPVVKTFDEVPEVWIKDDVYAAVDRADAVVLITEWPEFKDVDYERVASVMRGNYFLDGRNFLDPGKMLTAGLGYGSIGRLSDASGTY
jgi:nucleotide sugar dehydrogenase